MSSRILRLRICSWNVGNAQPPADLQKWLGVDEEQEYDIIVVGAQEAKFDKPEKTQSPTSILNPDTSSSSILEPMPLARQSSQSLPSISHRRKRFIKLAKVMKVAKTSIRDGSTKKTRLKAYSADSEDSYWGKYTTPVYSTEKECSGGIPFSPPSSPFRNRHRNSELAKVFSEDIPSLTFSQFVKQSEFDNLDESLVRRSRRSSRHSEVSIYQEPIIESSSSEESSSEDGSVPQTESYVDEDIEIATVEFSDLEGTADTVDKPNKLRSQMTSLLRIDEDGAGEKKFSRVLEKNMPDNYKLLSKHHLLGIKLLLFLNKKHEASNVEVHKQLDKPTGIGNVVGNKGAVAMKLTLYDTKFWFVSSHLAAHDGAKFLAQRHTDVRDIMRKLEKSDEFNVPLIHQADHVFWFGDLNYRLDLPHLLPAALTWSHEQKVAYVRNKILEKEYCDLSSFDELRREMDHNRVFRGFHEGQISFAPTFKVKRGQQGNEYQEIRVPGYCDRILWHSLPMHRNSVRLRAYDAVPELETSDHKPVYACFEVVIPRQVEFLPFPIKPEEIAVRCTIDFLRITVDGLYEKRMEMEDNDIQYEVLEDGALAVSDSPVRTTATKSSGAHTRRVVMASFHGNGLFIKKKPYRIEVPLRQGRREAIYKELPTIPLRAVRSLSQFTFSYITLVFTKQNYAKRSHTCTSCVIPLSKMLEKPGRHRVDMELNLIQHGQPDAKVRVVAELVPSATSWVDVENRPTMFKKKNQTMKREGTTSSVAPSAPPTNANPK